MDSYFCLGDAALCDGIIIEFFQDAGQEYALVEFDDGSQCVILVDDLAYEGADVFDSGFDDFFEDDFGGDCDGFDFF